MVMVTLYAEPYDVMAHGFAFGSAEEFAEKAQTSRNCFGYSVEEFELQFIDGNALDAALFDALGVHQSHVSLFFEKLGAWDEEQKVRAVIFAREAGGNFDMGTDDLDLDLYERDSLRDLAEEFVDGGLFGEIPEHLTGYIDYNAIARDLAMDYSQAVVARRRFFYRCE